MTDQAQALRERLRQLSAPPLSVVLRPVDVEPDPWVGRLAQALAAIGRQARVEAWQPGLPGAGQILVVLLTPEGASLAQGARILAEAPVDRSPGVIVLASDTPSHGPAPAAAVAWLRQELPGRVWLALGAVDPHAPADSFAWCTVAHRLAAGARLRREVVR